MKNPWKPSSSHFGPRIKNLPMRKTMKQTSRFVSPRMRKIHEEVNKKLKIMRTVGAANLTPMHQGVERNVPKVGNKNAVQSKNFTKSHIAPLKMNVGKSNRPPSMSQHMNKDHMSTIDSHSRYTKIVKGKDATLSPIWNLNDTLGSLEVSCKAKMNQRALPSSNCIQRSSETNHLKAMPGLIKNQPNLNQGATKRMHSESGRDGYIGGRTRFEPFLGGTSKKSRKYIETNDDVNDHQSNEDDFTRLRSYHNILNDCNVKISSSFVSKCVLQQYCCSMPIDESSWSGILKIDGKGYVSLAGHLSSKSGEKVWKLSKSLHRVVEATKVCRSKVWPKRWETSKPTSHDIGLYFFPYKMRPDKHYDQLVKEVMENDLALRAAVDEAEMLIFPSTLLPKEYQTFQSKYYLWVVFRPKVVEEKHGEELRLVDNSAKRATNATTSVHIDDTMAATDVVVDPADAPGVPTRDCTGPSNEGKIDSSRVVSFVVRQTPRVEQLIQEMEREGALIVATKGEMLIGDRSVGRQHGNHNGANRRSS